MIPKDSIIVCSNEECKKKLFKLAKDIEDNSPIYLNDILILDINSDFLKIGSPMVCPYCKARFIIPIEENKFKIHLEDGWRLN